MENFKRYLVLSQIHLFAWLLLSSALVSSVVFDNGGVSNYGNHYSSVIFYSLAFLVSFIYLYLAANSLLKMNGKFLYLARCIKFLCVLLFLVFITTFPRRFGDIFSDIHDNVSKFLFFYEFLFAMWMLYKHTKLDAIFYLLIMTTGSLIGLLSSMHLLNLMFIGQMVGALGFALLLVLVLPKIVDADIKNHTQKE